VLSRWRRLSVIRRLGIGRTAPERLLSALFEPPSTDAHRRAPRVTSRSHCSHRRLIFRAFGIGCWLRPRQSSTHAVANLRSRGSDELGPKGQKMRASVSLRPLPGFTVGERTGLIAKKRPPRPCWPSVWCPQVARHNSLGDAETEHQKLAMDPRRSSRELSRAIRAIRSRTSCRASLAIGTTTVNLCYWKPQSALKDARSLPCLSFILRRLGRSGRRWLSSSPFSDHRRPFNQHEGSTCSGPSNSAPEA
jgi:hypothetical protein